MNHLVLVAPGALSNKLSRRRVFAVVAGCYINQIQRAIQLLSVIGVALTANTKKPINVTTDHISLKVINLIGDRHIQIW